MKMGWRSTALKIELGFQRLGEAQQLLRGLVSGPNKQRRYGLPFHRRDSGLFQTCL